MDKRLKDPIYGYIEIDESIVANIIDTSCFQRLKNIRQTSYTPLYSSALHNRFIHSLGVFFLGKKAAKYLTEKIEVLDGIDYEQVKTWANIFILACLLHDVGHAPFSHSGEEFYVYKTNGEVPMLYQELVDTVQNEGFAKEVEQYYNSHAAAPHEIMSAIVSIRQFSEYFNEEETRDFFARCITGYKYRNGGVKNEIKNCFISLLNSSLIDVDKLDYLIRDAYTSGFDSISIDYARLLQALIIVKNKGKYQLAYDKGAISIIENVIYAHDAEKKWIQNHPTVLYDSFLIKSLIGGLTRKFEKENGKMLFSYRSLTDEGAEFGKNGRIRLLDDNDIIYLIKNVYRTGLSDEFFERRSRRHAIWKSEAEYKAIFSERLVGKDYLEMLEMQMEQLAQYFDDKGKLPVINSESMNQLKDEIKEVEENCAIKQADKIVQLEYKPIYLKIMQSLEMCAKKHSQPFNYILLQTNTFKSGFNKKDLEEMIIDFPGIPKKCRFKDVVSSLSGEKSARENMFYLFYERKANTALKPMEIAEALIAVMKEAESEAVLGLI